MGAEAEARRVAPVPWARGRRRLVARDGVRGVDPAAVNTRERERTQTWGGKKETNDRYEGEDEGCK